MCSVCHRSKKLNDEGDKDLCDSSQPINVSLTALGILNTA